MRHSPTGRRGFTIVEIITALTIIAIIGLAMTKLILGQTRSFQYDNGARRARAAARGAMNILITDLRMVQDEAGGVTAVDATNNRLVTVRVPTVFGVVCQVNAGDVVVALVPTDPFQLSSSKYGGYAIRNNISGLYTYVSASASDGVTITGTGRCRTANIGADTATIAGRAGGTFVLTPGPPGGTAVGDVVFVWQSVTYEFRNSGIFPGRLGLYRTVSGKAGTDNTADELMAPFSPTARFSYYTKNPYPANDTPATSAPAALGDIRGFQIFLPAESSDTMPTRNTPQSANATTAVFFKNVRLP